MRVRENITDPTTHSIQSAHNMAAFLTMCIRTVYTKITESLNVMFSHFYYNISFLKMKRLFFSVDVELVIWKKNFVRGEYRHNNA